jgi:hypothetical protein
MITILSATIVFLQTGGKEKEKIDNFKIRKGRKAQEQKQKRIIAGFL